MLHFILNRNIKIIAALQQCYQSHFEMRTSI